MSPEFGPSPEFEQERPEPSTPVWRHEYQQLLESGVPRDKLLILSADRAFLTTQGEGQTAGEPAVFLRLQLCNLDCAWCDTKHAITKEGDPARETPIIVLTDQQASEVVASLSGPNEIKRLVITGGEPLLQQASLVNFIAQPALDNWQIEIETNGTLAPKDELLSHCQFNCSPKLRNAETTRRHYINRDAIEQLKHGNTYFKFVVRDENDLDEIERDYFTQSEEQEALLSDEWRQRVYLLPLGTSKEEIDAVRARLTSAASQHGFNLGDRLQVRGDYA